MRISEIYTSLQGEGPRVGLPTIFLRFAGCNLRCPGWPCDTQHAIDPKVYRGLWKEFGVEQIFDMVMEEYRKTGARNVSLTGGEPFLQEAHLLKSLTQLLRQEGLTLEVWTNGTIKWPDWAMYSLSFIMDWKLKGSGEDINFLEIPMENVTRLTGKDVVKFTVVSEDDLKEAYNVWSNYLTGRNLIDEPQIFCGPVWGKMEPKDVASWILQYKLPWRLNLQLHKYIWNPNARRT